MVTYLDPLMTTYITGIPNPSPKESWLISCLTCLAGFPSPADNYSESPLDLYRYLVRNPSATFFMRVAGESMLGSCIHPGDILIVDRSLTPEDQDIVIAVVEGHLVVKRLRCSESVMALISEGSHSSIQVLDPETPFELWGVVTGGIHLLK